RGAVTIHRRAITADDFAGAAVAVGAFADDGDAAQFAAAARVRGVPVNVIDKPAFCDFAFGAIVNRSPLVIGISTDGAAPVFCMAVRAKIEAMIPRGFARWAAAARRWRGALFATGLSHPGRRRFWQIFARYAAIHPDREPTQSDFDGFLAETMDKTINPDGGSVTLVRARPGPPGALYVPRVAASPVACLHPGGGLGGRGNSRFGPPRSQEDAGGQDRPWPFLQAGRDQHPDGDAGQDR